MERKKVKDEKELTHDLMNKEPQHLEIQGQYEVDEEAQNLEDLENSDLGKIYIM